MADSESYGPDSEKAFVDGLGEWAECNRIKNHLTYAEWLQRYIAAYEDSKFTHHVIGVNYARLILLELGHEKK